MLIDSTSHDKINLEIVSLAVFAERASFNETHATPFQAQKQTAPLPHARELATMRDIK